MSYDLTDEQLRAIYAWIDAIPLSRPKRNMARDFSDGVMLAEVIAAYFPQLVEVHNYPAANSTKQKIYNHDTLNQKVLKKLNYSLPRSTVEDIVNCKPGVIESVLHTLQIKMAKYREKKNPVSPITPNDGAMNHPSKINHDKDNNFHYDAHEQKQSNRGPGGPSNINRSNPTNDEILFEKEQQIRELHETVEILELKVAKLEQLVRLKDNKIQKFLDA